VTCATPGSSGYPGTSHHADTDTDQSDDDTEDTAEDTDDTEDDSSSDHSQTTVAVVVDGSIDHTDDGNHVQVVDQVHLVSQHREQLQQVRSPEECQIRHLQSLEHGY